MCIPYSEREPRVEGPLPSSPVFWDSSMELTEKPHARVAVRRRQAPVMNSKRTFTSSCTELTRGSKQIPHGTLTPISTRGCRELRGNCLGHGMGRRNTSCQVSPVAVADANEYPEGKLISSISTGVGTRFTQLTAAECLQQERALLVRELTIGTRKDMFPVRYTMSNKLDSVKKDHGKHNRVPRACRG